MLCSYHRYAFNLFSRVTTYDLSSGHGIHRGGYTFAGHNDSCGYVQYHPRRDLTPNNPAHAEPSQQPENCLTNNCNGSKANLQN